MINHKNLFQRVLFALWAAPLGWWLMVSDFSLIPASLVHFLPAHINLFPVHVAILIIIYTACSEYIHMLSIRYPRNAFWLCYIWLTFQMLSFFFPVLSLRPSQDMYLLLLVVAGEAAFFGKNTGRWRRASLFFIGVMFLYMCGTSLLSFYHQGEPFQSMFKHFSGYAGIFSQPGIIAIVGSIIFCDTAAYFFGSAFGKHHFTRISPNKTVEGALAGFATAAIVFSVAWIFIAEPQYPRWMGIGVGMIIGIFAQLGDLLVSLIKRHFRVKDSSDLIPGHGGVLDRFDSIFFTAPVLWLVLQMIQRVYG